MKSDAKLIAKLDNPDYLKRLDAIEEIVKRHVVETVPRLIELLHGNYTLRSDIVNALGKLGDERAIEPLIKIMQGDPNPNHKINAIFGLKNIGLTQDSIAAMVSMFLTRDLDVCDAAYEVLENYVNRSTSTRGELNALLALVAGRESEKDNYADLCSALANQIKKKLLSLDQPDANARPRHHLKPDLVATDKKPKKIRNR